MIRAAFRALLAISLSCSLGLHAMADDYRFTIISFPGADETAVYGVNNLGVAVGVYGRVDAEAHIEGNRGFMYDGSTYTTIHVPDALSTSVQDINDAGVMVGEYLAADGVTRGFIYDGNAYTTIERNPGEDASVTGINNVGQQVGTFALLDEPVGFIRAGGAIEEFRYPSSVKTFLQRNNDRGEMVGTYTQNSALGEIGGGFFWTPRAGGTAGEFSQVDYPGGQNMLVTDARGLNNQGDVIGNWDELVRFEFDLFDPTVEPQVVVERHAFLLTADGDFVDLEYPYEPCEYSIFFQRPDPEIPNVCVRAATDINDAGMYVGYSDQDDGTVLGFIAIPESFQAPGDFNGDGVLDVRDLDQLGQAIAQGNNSAEFDVNGSGVVDQGDLGYWVTELKNTYFGDANLDGEFNSGDLVTVFAAGKYEQDVDAGWAEGDWTADARFNTGDLVQAFQGGGYEQGPLAVAVPEPATFVSALVAIFSLVVTRRWRQAA